jgi:hypothetical protein
MGRVAVVAIAITLMAGAAAEPAEARRANMPDGWKWPPTREMRREGKKCLADLRAMGVKFEKVRRKRKITTPIVVPDMRFGPLLLTPTFRKPPFVMDCRLARGIAQHAELITSLGVSELRFSTIYQYRKVRSRRSRRSRGALSRHALGLAIDVFELELAAGSRVVVKEQYWIQPTLVLIELALRSTGGFRAIISPSVDPISHRDHLHLEIAVEYPEEARKEAEKKEKLRQKRLAAKRRKLRAERKRLRAERKKRKERGGKGDAEPTMSAAAPTDAEAAEEPAAEAPEESEGPEDETTTP